MSMELNNDQFSQYRQAWMIRHQASIPKEAHYKAVHKYSRWVTFFVFAVFLAAGSISAVHTIPTVYNTIPKTDFIPDFIRVVVSLSAFIAIEGSVFLSAYILDSMPKMAWTVLGIGFGIAIVANTFSILGILGKDSVDVGVIIVGGALGFGAPSIALLMGKMYVDIIKTTKEENTLAVHQYTEACQAMDARVLNDYNLAVQKQERKQRPQPPLEDTNTVSTKVSTKPSIDTSKTAKRQRVFDYFDQHPDEFKDSVRTLAARIGDVSPAFIGNMKSEYLIYKENRNDNQAPSDQS